LAADIQSQLKEKCEDYVAYSIAKDERTDINKCHAALVFIRGVNEGFQRVEELIQLVSIKGRTDYAKIFMNW
jgi:hypothetical protein